MYSGSYWKPNMTDEEREKYNTYCRECYRIAREEVDAAKRKVFKDYQVTTRELHETLDNLKGIK